MKAAIIGIGTEITAGQILNSNGQWISKKMTQLGVEVSAHIAIPDDRNLILDTFNFCKDKCNILFITGGLGPTTDDFTRDMVAEWANRKMFYDQASYDKIEARLKARGIEMRASQKQQCYYPEGSKILVNNNGSANAFYLEVNNLKIFVLPGPPREIDGLWNDHIGAMMIDFTKNLDRLITKSWKCVGYGESEVAHRVETALQGCTLTKGYRFHPPYVEVKLSYYESQTEDAKKWIAKVEAAIGDIVDPDLAD